MASVAGDRLYAVAYRILRDTHGAEDAVQQTLLTAWRDLPKLRDDGRAEAWLYRILVHTCYAEARHVRRLQPGLWDVTHGDGLSDDGSSGIVMRDELERGFRRLSAEQRTVLVLHYYAGLTTPEIADVLNVSAGTVRSRMFYARDVLRGALEADARTGSEHVAGGQA
jgi:RNA polymerase sigma-70 factor (ECF subfamily)